MVVGYQVAGSLGRRLMDGEKEVRVLGEDILVRAKIVEAHGFSAHADKDKLYGFIAGEKGSLHHVFCVQGEEKSAGALAQQVKDRLGVPADVPTPHQRFEL
jgi:metallo-beta-lactamase family protein